MSNEKRIVLITGCSSGIGRQTAFFLKERGWLVCATARKIGDVEALRKEGFLSVLLDLNSPESIKTAVGEVLKNTKGRLDALINNAGYCQAGAIEDLPRETLRCQFETNFFGPLELTRLILPVFREQKRGRIIFVLSLNSTFAPPFMGAYAASKYALDACCDALRRELNGVNITITGIYSDKFKTKILDSTIRRSLEKVDMENSVYKDIYPKLILHLASAVEKVPEERTLLFAKTIYRTLESKRPKKRIALSFNTKLHYTANKLLPIGLQDALYYLKMKYLYKII